jgi:hypothetical protein
LVLSEKEDEREEQRQQREKEHKKKIIKNNKMKKQGKVKNKIMFNRKNYMRASERKKSKKYDVNNKKW